MSAIDVLIPRKVWTRQDVERLDPVLAETMELVSGELLDRMGKKPAHTYWKSEIRHWLQQQFGDEYVRTEDPIDVSPEDNPTSEPEPDVTITVVSRRQTRGANPKPEEIRLVVEVADTTFDYDTHVKASLYARAGIREYWVIDIRTPEAPWLVRFLSPFAGGYQSVNRYNHTMKVPVLDGRSLQLESLL